ncbi:Aminopeptidase O [Varanus komodoensis]|nr:Aminopeptidase O [Varanus komodoensis]
MEQLWGVTPQANDVTYSLPISQTEQHQMWGSDKEKLGGNGKNRRKAVEKGEGRRAEKEYSEEPAMVEENQDGEKGRQLVCPHIIFLSQSALLGGSHLCGARLCHEIAHAWFGLAIGARDWTEEWLSEGFATHLEDAFWSAAQQQLPVEEAKEQRELKALLRWHRLRDELQNSEEDLQVLSSAKWLFLLVAQKQVSEAAGKDGKDLFLLEKEAPTPLARKSGLPLLAAQVIEMPNKENTGKVSGSGASVVKHGLNAEKVFMQVHYLKGYFLLRSFAEKAGEAVYFAFLRKFVQAFHGQLILSQDFLHLLLEEIPQLKGYGLSVENIFQKWLDCSGIPKVNAKDLF